MTITELNQYIGESVRIKYTTKYGPQSRAGYVYTITTKKLIFLTFPPGLDHVQNDIEEEMEIPAPIDSITSIRKIKGALI